MRTMISFFTKNKIASSSEYSDYRKAAGWAAGAAGSALLSSAVLPFILTRIANLIIGKIPGWQGRLEGIKVHLFRGMITLKGLRLAQVIDHHSHPLIDIDTLTLSFSWRHLLTGQWVGDLLILRPRILIDVETLSRQKNKN